MTDLIIRIRRVDDDTKASILGILEGLDIHVTEQPS